MCLAHSLHQHEAGSLKVPQEVLRGDARYRLVGVAEPAPAVVT